MTQPAADAYGYGGYGGYDAGSIYGYQSDSYDAATGSHRYRSVHYDASGSYYRVEENDRQPGLQTSYHLQFTASDGVSVTDATRTYVVLDGTYESYGTRSTSSYNSYTHTDYQTDTSFTPGYSETSFYSYNHETGATVHAYDSRNFGSYGFYDRSTSYYSGPNGESVNSTGGYYASTA